MHSYIVWVLGNKLIWICTVNYINYMVAKHFTGEKLDVYDMGSQLVHRKNLAVFYFGELHGYLDRFKSKI